jgi:MFS family permease
METTYALLGAKRFELQAKQLGYVFTFIGVIVIIVQGGLIGRLVRRSGEQRIAFIGALIMMVSLTAVGLATNIMGSVAALGVLAAGQAFTSPTLATMLSKCASRDEQGGILGLSQSLAAAARATMPILAGWLFDQHAGLPYFVGTGICMMAAWCIGSSGLTRTLASIEPAG